MTATLDDVARQLEILNKICSRMVELLEFSNHEALENALSGIFANPRDRKIYELSDGSRSTREIGNIIGLDQKGISNLWKKWAKMDIVESTGHLKPYKAKYTIIELAKINKHKHEK
ncbi:MAG: hypothetical protein WBW94_16010 [Anaerolineales bacterium]